MPSCVGVELHINDCLMLKLVYVYQMTVDTVTKDSGLTVKQKNGNSVFAFDQQS